MKLDTVFRLIFRLISEIPVKSRIGLQQKKKGENNFLNKILLLFI